MTKPAPKKKKQINLKNGQKKISLPLSQYEKRVIQFFKSLSKNKKHGLTSQTQIDFLFVDDKEISRLHKIYFHDPTPTDVISFPLRGGEKMGKGDELLGEVIISVETAKKQAKEYGNSFNKEVILYMIHGVLHLLGYEDESPQKRKKMEKLQFELLEELFKPK